jgi:hypothetical protein
MEESLLSRLMQLMIVHKIYKYNGCVRIHLRRKALGAAESVFAGLIKMRLWSGRFWPNPAAPLSTEGRRIKKSSSRRHRPGRPRAGAGQLPCLHSHVALLMPRRAELFVCADDATLHQLSRSLAEWEQACAMLHTKDHDDIIVLLLKWLMQYVRR